MKTNGNVTVSVDVKNTGTRKGGRGCSNVYP